MSFGAGLLLLIWVVASILANGIALLHRFTKLRGLELIGYGAAAGVVLDGLLGWAIAAVPAGRWVCVGLLVALTLVSTVYFLARGVARATPCTVIGDQNLVSLMASLPSPMSWTHSPRSAIPRVSARWALHFKTHSTNVKIQYLTGLPADNYIGFAVAEFFCAASHSTKRDRSCLATK